MADLTEPSRPVRRAAGSEAGHKFTTGSPRTQAAADVDGRRSDRGPIGRQERPARRGLRGSVLRRTTRHSGGVGEHDGAQSQAIRTRHARRGVAPLRPEAGLSRQGSG